MLTLLMIQLTDHMLNIRLGTLPETAEPCTRIPTKHRDGVPKATQCLKRHSSVYHPIKINKIALQYHGATCS